MPLLRNALTCSLLALVSHSVAAAQAPAPLDSLRPLLTTLNERLNIGDLGELRRAMDDPNTVFEI